MKHIIFTALLGTFSLALHATDTLEMNKTLVKAFYNKAFNDHLPREAAQEYLGKVYVQHNPFAPDGAEAFATFFTEYYKKNPHAQVKIKRLVAEADLVVVHAHSVKNKGDRGNAVIDIFKVTKGKIVEHWDVMQKIPAKSANTNTMF